MAERFKVQTFLMEMRQEQREDTSALRSGQETLASRVEAGFKQVAETISTHVLEDTKQFGAIDKRLVEVENTRRSIRWLAGTVIVALVGAAADFLFVHLPKLLAIK